jgi:hypothetical protein
MDDMMQKLAKQMEDHLFAAIAGPPRKQRQTALRVRGRGLETVELDDAGNVIEPLRCTCGHYSVIHRPNCPFAYACT